MTTQTPTPDSRPSGPIARAEAQRRLGASVRNLLRDQPFFGLPALHLVPVADDDKKTIACDGVRLFYNPSWASSTPHDHLTYTLCRLVLACALKHHTRRGDRHYGIWQQASAMVCQAIMDHANIETLPHLKTQSLDMSVSDAYDFLYKQAQERPPAPQPGQGPTTTPAAYSLSGAAPASVSPSQPSPGDQPSTAQSPPDPSQPAPPAAGSSSGGQQPQSGQPSPGSGHPDPGAPPQNSPGGSTPGNQTQSLASSPSSSPTQAERDPTGHGEVIDSVPEPGSEESPDQSLNRQEHDWDKLMAKATQYAKNEGRGSKSLLGLVDAMRKPPQKWRQLLRRAMTDHDRSRYSIAHPSRRLLDQGIYIASLHGQTIDNIVFAVDTSGSVSDDELAAIWNQVRHCTQQIRPNRLRVIQCDDQIQRDRQYRPGSLPHTLEAKGRGGTKFTPVFDLIAKGVKPRILIYCTDMQCSDYPTRPPGYPVFWLRTQTRRFRSYGRPPFGTVIDVRVDI